MALVSMKELLAQADAQQRTVGAFNVSSIEMVCGVIEAAEELNTPVIIQVAESRLSTTPLTLLGRVMVQAAIDAKVDIAVHLDHGITLSCIKEALDLGFTSVMYDGSMLNKAENTARTCEVVRLARQYNAAIEGEIGHLGRTETGEEATVAYTDPQDAIDFARATGVDALAVAIGNAHGVYVGTPTFHFEVLEAIRAQCAVPLVLHGGTGSSKANFQHCVESGVRKINIATAIFQSCSHAVRINPSADWFVMSRSMTEAVKEVVEEHIRIFGVNRKE